MKRFIIARSSLLESDLKELKEKTGESTNNGAIATAIMHYICCPYAVKIKKSIEKKERKRTGRKPSYLAKFEMI